MIKMKYHEKKKPSEIIVAIEKVKKCFKVALNTLSTLQTKWSCEMIGSRAANINWPNWTKKKRTFLLVLI